MYLAIDIGGTKTLLAVFSTNGKLEATYKFPTNASYPDFLKELTKAVKEQFKNYKLTYCCCAVPGRLQTTQGVAHDLGNLTWREVAIKHDLEIALSLPAIIENDAKLAGLSEARLVRERYKRVQYITIGTGIGGGFIVNGVIDRYLATSEPGHMIFEYNGKLQKWEDFASGKAIVQRFGKRAADIDDRDTWRVIARDFALGLFNVVANTTPDVVIIGGGVGTHFHKFGDFLKEELNKMTDNMVPIPPIIGAKRPEEGVIYGCYEYLAQHLA